MLSVSNYVSVLRCIGQALQSRQVEVFQLTSESDEFHLQCGDPSPPYLGLVELRLSIENIKILEREGRSRRGQSNGEIRFESVPEILRAVGEYIDKKRVHLRRIDNSCRPTSEGPAIQIEYETRAGEIRSENLSMSIVRDTSVRMFKRRTEISAPTSIFANRR